MPLRRRYSGVAVAGGLGVAQRVHEPPHLRRALPVVRLATLHHHLEGLVVGQAVLFLAEFQRPAQDPLGDLEVVGHHDQIARQTVVRQAGRRFVRGFVRVPLRRSLLLGLRLLAPLQGALAGLLLLFRLGQVVLDDDVRAALDLQLAPLGAPLQLPRVDLFEHFAGLRELAGDVDHDGQHRLARHRRDQADRHVAAGHALHVLQRQSQPVVDARPPLLELPLDVLGEGLHHRVGHQVPKLRLVPVLLQRVDVGDGEAALGRVGQERFARPARRLGLGAWGLGLGIVGQDRLTRLVRRRLARRRGQSTHPHQQQDTRGAAKRGSPETGHGRAPCSPMAAGIVWLIGKVRRKHLSVVGRANLR